MTTRSLSPGHWSTTSRAIIFDLDDTLYSERQYVRSGFNAVAMWAHARLGIPAGEGLKELEGLFEQGVRGDTFQRWLLQRCLPSEPFGEQMVGVYRRHVPAIRPYPDVNPVLRAMRSRARLGLVTDGYVDVQRRKLEALGLLRAFGSIVISDALGPHAWKPSPAGLEVALSALEVNSAAASYVADNPVKDFIGARSIGMATIRIRRADGLHRYVEPASPKYDADAEITELYQLDEALLRLQRI